MIRKVVQERRKKKKYKMKFIRVLVMINMITLEGKYLAA